MANFIRNVLIDGVKYAVGDKRIEGDNFAYIQVPEAITVGTNLTDLAPIQKALDSADGSLLYVPSLNALFSPTASSDPTIRIWSSTVGDKGYQLKATLNASGVLQSAVVNEAAADSGLVISYADFDQLRTEAEDDDNWDATHTYLITDKAKEIAGKLFDIDGGLKAVGQFQLESGINPLYGIHTPLNYFYSVFEIKQLGSQPKYIARFTSSGIIEDMNVATGDLIEKKYDICPVADPFGVVGIIIEESEDTSAAFNINVADYTTIKNNTSQLTTPDSYDESALAKSIGQALKDHFYNYDGNICEWDIDHFTVSEEDTTPTNENTPHALSFYTLSNTGSLPDDTEYLKFTTTAEQYNGDIFVYYDGTDCLGMRIDPKPEDCVKVAKKYMEIEADTPENVWKVNVTGGDTLNLFSVQPSTTSKIVHYPESVLFTSLNAFKLKFAPDLADGSNPYVPAAKIEISKDGINWETPTWDENNGITLNGNALNPALGKYTVFIRGDNHFNDKGADKISTFSKISGSDIEVSGVLEALWGGKPMVEGECNMLFTGMTDSITKAHNLITPATTLAEWCYASMFADCTALTTAPALPATTLAEWCYASMFHGCTSLTAVPALPATTLAEWCYIAMFKRCTSLTTTLVLPATTLAGYCYDEMFANCTSLTTAPALPVTTLADNCYYSMFAGCTSLTQTPALPATTLPKECYRGMFDGCTALTKPVAFPEITAMATNCMHSMFQDCSNITWAAAGTPYEIKTTDGSTVNTYTSNMFKGNDGGTAIPETSGTPKLNTTYYLEA